MKVPKKSLLYFANCEIDDAIGNLFDFSLRADNSDEQKELVSQALTLLEVASDLLNRIQLHDD